MKKKIIIFALIGITFGFYFINRNQNENPLVNQNLLKAHDTKQTINAEVKNTENKTDNSLMSIAKEIAPISFVELKNNWENEYGCNLIETCDYFLLNAKSLDEAEWMYEKGYLSKSVIDKLSDIPKRELARLANKGNINASKLMALYAISQGNIKAAKGFATNVRAIEKNGESFGLRLTAQAYLLDKNPMLATIELRMAALLGDTDANLEYEKLTMNSSRGFIDHVNELAYNYLSAKYNVPIGQWNNQPRPNRSGGG